jgi:hypothetical protein
LFRNSIRQSVPAKRSVEQIFFRLWTSLQGLMVWGSFCLF